MKNRLLLWLMMGLSLLIIMQNLNAPQNGQSLTGDDIGVMTQKSEVAIGKEVVVEVQNNTDETIEIDVFPESCPEYSFTPMHYENGEWIEVTNATSNTEAIACMITSTGIAPGEKIKVSYKDWSYRLFGETGRYRIDVTAEIDGQSRTFSSNEFTIVERGIVGRAWLNLVYRPILNGLVELIKVMPNHSLGLAIIALTLILRTLLLIPSQRAMRSQKKLQEIQGKIEALKKKYKDDQERLALETVNLWKTHKVNPFGSCLMMLIQFPILIALYYVVREGLHVDKLGLLYGELGNFSFDTMNTDFLGVLELTEINFIVLPLIVGGLQFVQMSLAMNRKKKKDEAQKASSSKKKKEKAVKDPKDMQNEMQMATKMMKYVMPVMIAVFTASLPAGVGLYWATSTSYGILQQFVVNRESDRETKDNEPTVKVIS